MLDQEALEYHRRPPKGKIVVQSSKPAATQRDLVLAYTPGVASPCREIARQADLVYEYTARGNLVGVITNGTAVLGLGNIGPLASKPVMEGKAVLFKTFADIDVFDLELDASDPEQFIAVVRALEPTFGGINLEDIKAPECFQIERALQEAMEIPVFHDDQHGTAIITGAALLNALSIVKKDIAQVRVVFVGAGAAGIGCARFYSSLGVRREHIVMFDSKSMLHAKRENLIPEQQEFAMHEVPVTLQEALQGADVFVGLSAPDILSPEMLAGMAVDPIIFALANPDPEISYPTAREARPDAIIATGRSDYPNQVNNVLGFPFLFRGALDVQARQINEPMKLAAAHALAALAKEDTPDEVLIAYGLRSLHFGREYLIPTPFDPRVLMHLAPAVAQAAIQSGVARIQDLDLDAYRDRLAGMRGTTQQASRRLVRRAVAKAIPPPRIAFPEGHHETILRACHQIVQEGIAQPVLVGETARIRNAAEEWQVSLEGLELLDHRESNWREEFAQDLFVNRARKGMERQQALRWLELPTEFALMMLHSGKVDGFVGGITRSYPQMIRPALQIIGARPEVRSVSGCYLMFYRERTIFFADTTVNTTPPAALLADVAIHTARVARFFGEHPRVAFLSYSNFGSVRNADLDRIREALEILHEREPSLMADGEMQGHLAIDASRRQALYPFCALEGEANVLIFPNLHAAISSYRLLSQLSEGRTIGPILSGMNKPVNVLSQEARVQDVVNMAALSVLEKTEGVL